MNSLLRHGPAVRRPADFDCTQQSKQRIAEPMSASHYNAAPLHGSPLVSAAQGNMIQGGFHPTQAEPCWLVRYELAFLAFFGFFNVCEFARVHLDTPFGA
jgi:hypothetical protein